LESGDTFCIAQALVDAYLGDWETGLFFVGSNAWRCSKIDTVAGIFEELAT
jgi:nitronate monooxygenase